jgi:hypothetical protein
VLDLCDTTRSADKRLITTVAPQALTLFNGAFVNSQAKHLAARLETEAGSDPGKQIERAFLLALCRPPSAKESGVMRQFLERAARAWLDENNAPSESQARRHALEQVCRVIFNMNEFVYPD